MTAIAINIPNHEVSFFKKMIAKMGWTYTVAGEESTATKTRIYDPETGCYLKDSVVKSIKQSHDDMKHGRPKAYESVDEMFSSSCSTRTRTQTCSARNTRSTPNDITAE